MRVPLTLDDLCRMARANAKAHACALILIGGDPSGSAASADDAEARDRLADSLEDLARRLRRDGRPARTRDEQADRARSDFGGDI